MVPQLLEGWFGTLLSLRHKIARAGRLLRRVFRAEMPRGEELEEGLTGGRERIMELRRQLMNPDKTQIVLVTIPEPMSVLETSRTLRMLSSHQMPVATIVVNQLQPASDGCPHCAHRRSYHERELQTLRAELSRQGSVPIRIVESQPWEICGPEALQRIGGILWAEEAESQGPVR
jgi:anion-transporting  ArsA/GET3 family ATPase